MHLKIDWLSYSLRIPEQQDHEADSDYFRRVNAYIPEYLSIPIPEWGSARRRGQRTGMNIGDHTFLWIHAQGWLTVEHTGQGCSHLARLDILDNVIREYGECATRVDIAVDLHDVDRKVTPAGFAGSAKTKRTTAYGVQNSATGQTVYLGSKKSPRYVRVYRYSPPHPRQNWLRIEYVFRKEHAKELLVNYMQDYNLARLAVACGNHYKWSHPLYTNELTDIHHDYTIDAPRHDRKSSDTVFWLHNTIARTIVKQSRLGVLDLNEYIEYLRFLAKEESNA